ncbi:phosphoribosylglycinamide formyltransferase [Patescibacteria group bacterium]|nr:phosphoribosylglycinamide formyltransferase [Patescibacteria group bacterium]MBU1673350.1 phosphoribosylglycinamide formyltransferase [Patescibacteria group bacterium]MBU1963531.1 phosphoribosylglycinamide formyltransferase [Patescibacteria group bacterium]
MKPINIAVLGSTRGTDLQAIIDAKIPVKIIISNKKDAFILERAEKAGIPALFISQKDKSREEFDEEVMKVLEENNIDLVLLIGYMRFLSKPFVDKYENKIMNVHPSLLPKFAGGMDANVHQEVLDAGEKETGATIHFVDEGADTGPIVLQEKVAIADGETVDSLKEKVQKLEGEMFIKAIDLFADGKIEVKDNKVIIKE